MMYDFDPTEARDMLIAGIHKIVRKSGFSKVVVGISGGKDSTVTAALCVRALGKENVIGVLLPDGEQKDIGDSYRICKLLGIPFAAVNIGAIHESLISAVHFSDKMFCFNGLSMPVSKEAEINVPPRIRMTVLRYIAQATGALLAGTGNLSEITVGYCTKDGDTSCDFSVLGGLTSKEVVEVGLTLDELPKELVLKTPSDGLCGMTDEEKIGVSYEEIHHYIRRDKDISDYARKKISDLESRNLHKRNFPQLAYNMDIYAW